MNSLTIALAFAGLSVAQSTTSLFIPGADTQPFIASIIGSDSAATTYAVECVPGTDASECGFPGGLTLTAGPSTAAYTLSLGYENGTSSVLAITGYIDCKVTGSTAAVCTESFGGDEADDPGMSTTTLDPTEIVYMPVTLTDSLPPNTDFGTTSAFAAPSTSGAVLPATTSSSAPTASNTFVGKSTSSGKSTGTSASGTGAAQSAGTTSPSKAGAAQVMITGKAQWAVGAAAVGLAFL